MTITKFNQLTIEKAQIELENCCVANTWIQGMISERPFSNFQEVLNSSDKVWSNCIESDFLEAFMGHPKIGDLSTLAKKFINSSDMAANEQSCISAANDDIIRRLAKGNQEYESKFGFIFIICATGKSAQEILSLLEERMLNSYSEELCIAAKEQHKITAIRLEKLLT